VTDQKPTILILCDYYLPGYQAGGPIRSLDGMVSRLSSSYRMIVVTRDRDLGDEAPFAFLADKSGFVQVGAASVLYLSPAQLTPWHIASVLRTVSYDVLYVNSLFSKWFSIVPLWLRKFHLVPRRPVVVAPRGELGIAPQQLGSKRSKALYRAVSSALRIFQGVVWHASSEMEFAEICNALGPAVDIQTARDLAAQIRGLSADLEDEVDETSPRSIRKERGSLSAVFLSRIVPIKNLSYALELLRNVHHPVSLDIYGPKEDGDYWQSCEAIIRELPDIHTVTYRGVAEHGKVREIFSNYHLLFFPTQNENFGHVILEALTAGCPVLTSDRTPWPNLEAEGAGWSIALSDPGAYRARLERCAQMDSAELETLRQRAFELGHRTVEDPEAIRRTSAIFERATGHGSI
jgi:glycosyltransferase involved in cell wall biosynthesis